MTSTFGTNQLQFEQGQPFTPAAEGVEKARVASANFADVTQKASLTAGDRVEGSDEVGWLWIEVLHCRD